MRKLRVMIWAGAIAAAPLHAQNVDPGKGAPTSTYAAVMAQPVPVTAGDITDRPYRVIGDVTKEVRRATVFSKNASDEKTFRELWEKARKLGADAVVNAHAGDARVIALSWGSRRTTGQAVKFLTDAEIAQRTAR